MSTLLKSSFILILFFVSTYLAGQDSPHFTTTLEDYVLFMHETNRVGNKFLIDFIHMKDTIEEHHNLKEIKNERMIIEESIQNALMLSFITKDMVYFINLSGYLQFIDEDQLKGEALELIRVDVIENYEDRIDVMIKAATQNSLLTNSRTLLKMMDQFKEVLSTLKEKLIEIREEFFIDWKTARR